MEEPITRAEYEEYQKRIEDEDHRQNKRIEQLEENTKQINALTVSIEKPVSYTHLTLPTIRLV